MIQEDYVSFETAKLLKERGFSENTEHEIWYVIKQFSTGCYWNSCTYKVGDITREYNNDCCIPMPTLQMAMKRLRVKYHLHISISLDYNNPRCYEVKVMHTSYCNDIVLCSNSLFNSYEQACEEAIKYCLENLI